MLTILSLLGGGLMRLLPEVFGLLHKLTDNSHELAMMDKQLELQKALSAEQRQTIETQGAVDLNVEEMKALSAALTAQMQKTGYWIVDVLNFLVRPLTTYYFLACYGIYKTAMLYAAFRQADVWRAILATYDADDKAILFGILSFWFVGRVIDKARS